MKRSWLGVAVLALILIGVALIARAADVEPDFAFESDRFDRAARIRVELRQISAEKAKLDEEALSLMRERSCVLAAKDRKTMQACARR